MIMMHITIIDSHNNKTKEIKFKKEIINNNHKDNNMKAKNRKKK